MNDNDLLAVTVFTFPSTHHAFMAEKVCREAGFPVLLIPQPKELGVSCSVTLIISPELAGQAGEALERAGTVVTGRSLLTRERRHAHLWQKVL